MIDDDHVEFLHNDKGNGFTVKLKNSFPSSLLDAYYSGYDACRDDDNSIYPDRSYAQLEDSGDGIPHQKGDLVDDGKMAIHTYI